MVSLIPPIISNGSLTTPLPRDEGARDKRNELLDAMEQIPAQSRMPEQDLKRPWTPMVPLFNAERWQRVSALLMKYVEDGKPDEYRAEACRRIEKAMTEPRHGHKLDLSGLGLRELPPLLPEVAELDLSRNRLTSLPTLPCRLTKLFLSHNQLKTLPPAMPSELLVLDVAYNDLSELPSTLPEGITAIHAQGNALLALPVNLPRTLQILDVCNNRGPNLAVAAAKRLVELAKRWTSFDPTLALIAQGRRREATMRCTKAMEAARSSPRGR